LDINFDLAVVNGLVYTAKGPQTIDIWIKDGRVAAMGGPHRAPERINAQGMLVLPGCIDAHVHFRDPGQNYKEDWTRRRQVASPRWWTSPTPIRVHWMLDPLS
jgi:dihydroorotase-like cyclic amidohydrolase